MAFNFSLGNLFVRIGADTAPLKQAGKEINKTAKKMEKDFLGVGSALKAFLAGEAIRRAILMADSMVLIDQRIKQLTKSTQEAEKTTKRLFDISSETGLAIERTVDVFQKFKFAQDALNATDDDILQLSENVQRLGLIGGSTTEQMGNSFLQLSQALNADIFRAEEFNSVLENTPLILSSIEKGMGISRAELTKMVRSGKLLSKDVFEAILNQTDDIASRMADAPRGMSVAFTGVINEVMKLTANLDETFLVTGAIKESLKGWQLILAEINGLFEDNTEEEIKSLKIKQSQTVALRDQLAEQRRQAISNKESQGLIQNLDRRIVQLNLSIGRTKRKLSELGEDQGLLTFTITGQPPQVDPKKDTGRFKQEEDALLEQQRTALNNLKVAIGDEFTAIQMTYQDHYDRLKELTVEGTAERIRLEKQMLDQAKASELAVFVSRLSTAESFFATANSIAVAAGEEGTDLQRALFLSMKAIQVAQIIAATEVSAAQAGAVASVGGPFAWLGTQAGIRTLGYANAGLVAGLSISQNTGPGRRNGGPLLPGMLHPVTEDGNPEALVTGGQAMLLPGSKGGKIIPFHELGGNGGQPQQQNIIIQNLAPGIVHQVASMTETEVVIIAKQVSENMKNEINASIATNTGQTANALNQAGIGGTRKL